MNLSRVVRSQALGAAPFIIERNAYLHQVPRAVVDYSQQIMANGVIYPGNAEMIEQLPEEHKHDEFIVVFCDVHLSLGVKDGERFTAPDRIHWNDQVWRLVRILNWGWHGYWEGLAVLLSGEEDGA